MQGASAGGALTVIIAALAGSALMPAVGQAGGEKRHRPVCRTTRPKSEQAPPSPATGAEHTKATAGNGPSGCRKGHPRRGREHQPGAHARSRGKAALQIMYTDRQGFAGLTYTLRCKPASGTLADPSAACARIAQEPGMVFAKPYGDHSCPPSSSLHVEGEYGGRPVNVTFSRCAFGPDFLPSWEHFLPTAEQQNEVSLDRAIGPFQLGQPQSAVEALLSRDSAESAGSLDVYHPWNFVETSCTTGINGSTPAPILAVRYDGRKHVETVIGNQNSLTIDGQRVWSLLTPCEGQGTPRSEGPLKDWVPVTCGGREAIADAPLPEEPGEAESASTILVPAGTNDQAPLVVVTRQPTSACEDVARLQAEGGA